MLRAWLEYAFFDLCWIGFSLLEIEGDEESLKDYSYASIASWIACFS